MFRVLSLSRVPNIFACDSVIAQVLPSSSLFHPQNVSFVIDVRLLSTRHNNGGPFGVQRGGGGGVGTLGGSLVGQQKTGLGQSLMKSLIPVQSLEQVRGVSFFGKEGRISWRKRRARELQEREHILDPQSPVVDQMCPWPKDDTESLPPGFFGEEREVRTRQEEIDAQNAVLQKINDQVKDNKEGRLFAVIHICGKQFKVTPEDIIVIQKYFPPNIGDTLRLHKILMVGSKDFTLLGRPMIDQDLIRVEATVIEKTLSYTKMHFKMRKRKNYRRLKFFKTPYTMMRINLIELREPLSLVKSDENAGFEPVQLEQ